MKDFYFTFGSNGYPFSGGWVKVTAESTAAAIACFNLKYGTPGNAAKFMQLLDRESFRLATYDITGCCGGFERAVLVATPREPGCFDFDQRLADIKKELIGAVVDACNKVDELLRISLE